MVSRRQALRTISSSALTVGIAGCLSSPDSNSGDTGTPNISFSAEVLNSFSTDQPSRLRLRFGNETDSTLFYRTGENSGQRGLFHPVKGYHQSSGAELLLLLPGAIFCKTEQGTPSSIPETPTDKSNGDGCWRPPCEELLLYSFNPTWEELEPDAPWRAEYVLLDGFNDTCLPSGQYEFTTTGRITAGPMPNNGQLPADAETWRVERRLTVTLDNNLEVSAEADASVSEMDSS